MSIIYKHDFKVGDVLKSKEHNRTVCVHALTSNPNILICDWFEGSELHREMIHPKNLSYLPEDELKS